MSRILLSILGVVSLVVLVLGPAHATSLLYLDPERLVKASECVVIGTVKSSESAFKDGSNQIRTYSRVSVGEKLKQGTLRDKEIYVEQLGGRVRDVMTIVPGVPALKVGSEVVLFLRTDGRRKKINLKNGPVQKPTYRVVGMSQGKLDIRVDPASGKKIIYAKGETVNSVLGKTSRTRNGKDSLPPGAVYLDDFAQEIKLLVRKTGGN